MFTYNGSHARDRCINITIVGIVLLLEREREGGREREEGRERVRREGWRKGEGEDWRGENEKRSRIFNLNNDITLLLMVRWHYQFSMKVMCQLIILPGEC